MKNHYPFIAVKRMHACFNNSIYFASGNILLLLFKNKLIKNKKEAFRNTHMYKAKLVNICFDLGIN